MTDKQTHNNRRKLLKSIAAGSGAVIAGKSLPESWNRPVVDAVMLPAHAATTGETGTESTTVKTCGPFCADQGDGQFVELTVNGTTVSARVCAKPDGLALYTGSGPLTNGTFNFQYDNAQGWVRGTISGDCTSASVQLCAFENSGPCGDVIPLSPGSCGICDAV